MFFVTISYIVLKFIVNNIEGVDIIALIIGIVIAFVMAMPPGPVAVALIKLSIDKGMSQAVPMAAGTGFTDMVMCLTAVFFTEAVGAALRGFVELHPIITLLFQAAVIIALVVFGFISIFNKNFIRKPENNHEPVIRKPRFASRIKSSGPVFLGIGMASANIANPAFLASLTVVASQVRKFGVIDNPFWDSIFYSIGFGAGNFLWLLLVAGLVTKYKHVMGDRMFTVVRQVAGLVFIAAGVLIALNVVKETNWSGIY